MHTIKKSRVDLPKPLYQVKKLFERWRQTHRPRSRFTEELWTEAVAVAREYGHNLTAKTLGLDYYSLKKRISDTPSVKKTKNKVASPFVELMQPTRSECTIEIENGESKKMRISLKGADIQDLVSISRSLWRAEA